MSQEIAYILVGDHLGQVKKVLIPSYELSLLPGCASPDSSNPVVSIEPFKKLDKQLIANRNGEIYVHDSISQETKLYTNADNSLEKAIPFGKEDVLLIYDKQVSIGGKGYVVKQKKGEIKNAIVNDNQLAFVGIDIPLRIFDIQKKLKIFDADPPEKDWLGIQPGTNVSGLDFVGTTRIATCSKSDSVIRIYDTLGKHTKPVISVNVDQVAFNEHADSVRFVSVASTSFSGHSIVVGSNVGQMLAVDLRFNVKKQPKKKQFQPKTHKIVGGFKGFRGASIKDVKVVGSWEGGDESHEHKVISCCLDRYLRVHNWTRNSRKLDQHVYMITKPYCCSPVFRPE